MPGVHIADHGAQGTVPPLESRQVCSSHIIDEAHLALTIHQGTLQVSRAQQFRATNLRPQSLCRPGPRRPLLLPRLLQHRRRVPRQHCRIRTPGILVHGSHFHHGQGGRYPVAYCTSFIFKQLTPTLAMDYANLDIIVLGRLRLLDRPRIRHQCRLLVPLLLHFQVRLHHVHGSATDSVCSSRPLTISTISTDLIPGAPKSSSAPSSNPSSAASSRAVQAPRTSEPRQTKLRARACKLPRDLKRPAKTFVITSRRMDDCARGRLQKSPREQRMQVLGQVARGGSAFLTGVC